MKKLSTLELHHRIITFVLVVCVTIIVTRAAVAVHDPNPKLFGFELHHFDYGLLLLFITNLLLLFGRTRYLLYLFLSAIAFGLVLDDLWFIRINTITSEKTETAIYNTTFSSVVVFVIAVILISMLINHFTKKRE